MERDHGFGEPYEGIRRRAKDTGTDGFGESEKNSVDFGGTGRRRRSSGAKKDGDGDQKLVVSFSMFGGVGNQIYFMLESIYSGKWRIWL